MQRSGAVVTRGLGEYVAQSSSSASKLQPRISMNLQQDHADNVCIPGHQCRVTETDHCDSGNVTGEANPLNPTETSML